MENDITISNILAVAWHLEQGHDNGKIPREALALALRHAMKKFTELEAENAGLRSKLLLHPTGACTCAGEGHCAWCQQSALREERDAALALLEEGRRLLVYLDTRSFASKIIAHSDDKERAVLEYRLELSVAKYEEWKEFLSRPLPKSLQAAGERVKRREEALRAIELRCGLTPDRQPFNILEVYHLARAALGEASATEQGEPTT